MDKRFGLVDVFVGEGVDGRVGLFERRERSKKKKNQKLN